MISDYAPPHRIIVGMSHFGPAVSHATAKDPLFRMRAYQIAADLLQAAWHDAKRLSEEPVTERIAGQLYAAVNSITATLGGVSRAARGRIEHGFSNMPLVPSAKA
jgi:hypothetical protein